MTNSGPVAHLVCGGSEWAVNMHRDTLAAHVGHYPMTMFFAVAENESIGRVKYNLMQVTCDFTQMMLGSLLRWQRMFQPCGPPVQKQDDE